MQHHLDRDVPCAGTGGKGRARRPAVRGPGLDEDRLEGADLRALDPGLDGQNTTSLGDIESTSGLFVFNDAAMSWRMGGRSLFQNSTYLEPVTGNWVQQPTSHFRHNGKTNALTADGHAGSYEPRGWVPDAVHSLGFVGEKNSPHYAQ